MIITRSPLRITLGGGGTDLPSYYQQHGGFVCSAAINKYVYITLHQTFFEDLILKYSRMERVRSLAEIEHPLIREALSLVGQQAGGLEITSMSDIPAGTGLGSSASFLTALLYALHVNAKSLVPRQELAEQACHIEMVRLGEPVGKQDQYIAAFGGLTTFDFGQDGKVVVAPLRISAETTANLEDNLILFYTGFTRSAASILGEQDERSRRGDTEITGHLHLIKQLGYQSRDALESGDLRGFAELMRVHWESKKHRSKSMTTAAIDSWYNLACQNGAMSGKLIGAGGGGFLLFYTEDKTRLRHVMQGAGLREVRMRFDFQGTTLVTQS